MPTEVEFAEASDYQGFVEQHPRALVYHTLHWQRLIENTYGYRPRYIVARDGGRISGVLPLFEVNSLISGRHLTAIPFSHYVPVLYKSEEVLHALVGRAKQLAIQRGSRYIEVRGSAEDLVKLGFETSSHSWISLLDLEVGQDTLQSNIRSSSWRNVKKACRNNLVVREGRSAGDFECFYQMIVETRRYQGVPPYPKRLFEMLRTTPETRLYLAYQGDEVLAGIILLCYDARVIYAYGASVKDAQKLRLRPNDLLFWHTIGEMQAEGYKTFDFGTTPIHNDGLLRFKENWGPNSRRLAYAYWLNATDQVPLIDRSSRAMEWASTAIRRMPLWAVRIVGDLFFKQLG